MMEGGAPPAYATTEGGGNQPAGDAPPAYAPGYESPGTSAPVQQAPAQPVQYVQQPIQQTYQPVQQVQQVQAVQAVQPAQPVQYVQGQPQTVMLPNGQTAQVVMMPAGQAVQGVQPVQHIQPVQSVQTVGSYNPQGIQSTAMPNGVQYQTTTVQQVPYGGGGAHCCGYDLEQSYRQDDPTPICIFLGLGWCFCCLFFYIGLCSFDTSRMGPNQRMSYNCLIVSAILPVLIIVIVVISAAASS